MQRLPVLSVITGASGDLGSAVLRACIERGHQVVAVGRDEEKLQNLFTEVLKTVHKAYFVPIPLVNDVSTVEGQDALLARIKDIPASDRYLFNIAGTYFSDENLRKNNSLRTSLENVKVYAPFTLTLGHPWTASVYSSSQAEVLDLPGSALYGSYNRKGSGLLMGLREDGRDTKTVLFGNLESKTADGFNLKDKDVIPIDYAANVMLETAMDPSIAARIVIPDSSVSDKDIGTKRHIQDRIIDARILADLSQSNLTDFIQSNLTDFNKSNLADLSQSNLDDPKVGFITAYRHLRDEAFATITRPTFG